MQAQKQIEEETQALQEVPLKKLVWGTVPILLL